MSNMIKKLLVSLTLTILLVAPIFAAEYVIDTKGMHAFVQFRVKHLGYSWLYGRFNEFEGRFNFGEENQADNAVFIDINTDSLDTNHAERDKHLRSSDFLDTDQFPSARFQSSSYQMPLEGESGKLIGDLTLHGVTKSIEIEVQHLGGGDDPWGGYRNGFEGRASIKPEDFGIDMVGKLGPAAAVVELMLSIEGVRQ